MIKTTRLPEPNVLQQNGRQWTAELCEARSRYYEDSREFEGEHPVTAPYPKAKRKRYAHPEIKGALGEMFGAKCAYCESRVTAVSYQHVEHFRPQSVYPRLAYDWDNLLLACTVCNSGYKRDQFPLIDGIEPRECPAAPCSLDGSDHSALVNPCIDDPEDFFTFEDEWIVCLNDRARLTRDVCGLNREDLKDSRKELLILVEAVAKAFLFYDKQGDQERRTEFARTLKRYLHPSTSYFAMTRAKLLALGVDIEEILNL